MKVKVLSIQPTKELNSHEVLLTIGTDSHSFLLKTEVNKVGEHLLQTTHGDRAFSEVFRFNQRVAMKVTDLVVKFNNEEAVELPADVGNFVTPEAAVSKLKPFDSDGLLETSTHRDNRTLGTQSTEEIRREVRNRAIALLEELPDAMLDEAVKFLESLYVKADRVE